MTRSRYTMNEKAIIRNKRLVFRLIELTTDQEITWTIETNNNYTLPPEAQMRGEIYSTSYSETNFRMVKYKLKGYYAENVQMEMINQEGEVIYTFPEDNLLADLYGLVAQKVSGVKIKDVFDSILGEDDPPEYGVG